MSARQPLTTGLVIRLSSDNVAKRFSPSGNLEAQPADFRLSDNEQATLKANGGVGQLSVWDKTLTSPQQAQAFLTPNHKIVFDVDVPRILGLGLFVFMAPLQSQLPGANGHCNIEDVWGGSEEAMKRIRLDILTAVIGPGAAV